MPSLSRLDLRHVVRALRRTPVFTLTAVLSLAIGIGATTAIVTLADGFLVRRPPGIGEPERLVSLGRSERGRGFDNLSHPDLQDVRAQSRTLEDVAAIQLEPREISLLREGGGEAVQGAIVGGNFFTVLQATPQAGRFFAADEDRPGAPAVAVISDRMWRGRFAGDRGVVGRTVTLNGNPFTIVGIAQPGFRGPYVIAPDLWIPVHGARYVGMPAGLATMRDGIWLVGIGRLRPGVPLATAQAELDGVARAIAAANPEAQREEWGLRIERASALPGDMKNAVRGLMALLLAVSGLVLLIAGTNVAGMMLARGASRSRELAVRSALGASRGRLVGQLVAEGMVVAVGALAIGVALAQWLVAGLMRLVPRLPVQLAIDTSLDVRIVALAALVALVSGVLTALVPALRASRPALVPALRSDTAGAGERLRLRSGLLVAQIAFSMVLLVSAGLFARALVQARAIDPGFDPRHVHVARTDLGLAQLDSVRGRQLVDALLERTRALPGVQAAATTAMLPLDGGGLGMGRLVVPDRPASAEEPSWRADWTVVTPGYFEVLRMSLVAGRDFTDGDRPGAPEVVIINETLARQIWPEGNWIGRQIRNEEHTLTVVGVARDAKYRSLGDEPRGFVYVPLAQRWFERTAVIARHAPGVELTAPMRRLVAELAPTLPLLDQRSMTEQAAISLFPQTVALWAAGSLGGVALLLALLGIYGVTAYGVARRTREIGIRVALGATQGSVQGLVLRQGMVLAAGGVVAGGVLGAGAARLLGGMLYGVPPVDPVAFGGAAGLLVVAALAASWLPARRAAGVEPMRALRSE